MFTPPTIKPGYSKKHTPEHERCVILHKDVKKAFNKLCVKKLTTVNLARRVFVTSDAEKNYAQ